MEIHEWLELICQVGTLVFAALTYFNGKNKPSPRLKNLNQYN